jgi:hypothetical protein
MLDSSQAHAVKHVKGHVKTLPSVAKGTEQQPGPDSWDQRAVKNLYRSELWLLGPFLCTYSCLLRLKCTTYELVNSFESHRSDRSTTTGTFTLVERLTLFSNYAERATACGSSQCEHWTAACACNSVTSTQTSLSLL